MRGTNEHLTVEEIEQLTAPAADFASGALEGAMRHLDSCEQCRFRMLFAQNSADPDFGQASTAGSPSSQSHNDPPGCPEESRWLELAAGVLPKEERTRYLEHAVACSHCGPLLKVAIEDVGRELTPEEETKVASLSSANPVWQESLVARITGAPAPKAEAKQEGPRKTLAFWPRWAFASAAAVVAAVAGWWGWLQLRTPSVDALLAQAYTEQRAIEMRIPGAKYAPMRVQRGGQASRTSLPQPLLDAESRIAKQLRLQPGNVNWLRAQGVADLLDNNPEAAVASLQEAHRLSPTDDTIAVDLASALSQRAGSQGSPEDYNQAIDLLRGVTFRDPNNAVAWFNLAIASEHMHYFRETLHAWETYLKIDDSSGWAAEARSRKVAVEKELADHSRRSTEPLLDPKSIIQLVQSDEDSALHKMDQRVEAYLDVATSQWLPEVANPGSNPEKAGTTRQALEVLAKLLSQRHGDVWLEEIITSLDTTQAQAFDSLARAVALNASGEYSKARDTAGESAQEFGRLGSSPGQMRAQIEDVYASHLLQQGASCLSEASGLLDELTNKSYSWLETQTQLETAICANMMGQMKDAGEHADSAAVLSQKHNYGVLYLRGAALLSTLAWTSGDLPLATKIANDALTAFWGGAFPEMRGYNLYAALDSIAEDSEQWFTDVAVAHEAVGLIVDGPDYGLLALEYQRLAQAAVKSGELKVAEKSLSESRRLFSLALPSATEMLRAGADIETAKMELARREFEAATRRLESVEPLFARTANRFLALDFYLTQSDALRGSGQYQAAKQASLHAAGISEEGLTTIDGEHNRMAWTKAYDRTYRAVVRVALLDNPDEAFLWWEWYKSAALRKSPTDGWPPGRSEPSVLALPERRHLTPLAFPAPPDTALLSYILLPDRVGAWFHDNDQTRYLPLSISPNELQQVTQAFGEHCSDPKSDEVEIRSEARHLYDVLVQPFAALIKGHKKLLIEADGTLDAVAFEALMDEHGKLLGDALDIAMSTGMAYVAASRPLITIQERPTMLVVGNPSADVKSGDHRTTSVGVDAEAKAIAQIMPNSRLLLGSGATTFAILEAIRQADIFHFAGHAVPTRDGSALLLARGQADTGSGLLDATRLETMSLKRTRLVVLSACASAGNENQTLSESSSLARTFLAAGVPQVIASRWPVDSEATARLMERFYRELASGSSTSDALRVAKARIRTEMGYSHPYYWLAFSVFGRA